MEQQNLYMIKSYSRGSSSTSISTDSDIYPRRSYTAQEQAEYHSTWPSITIDEYFEKKAAEAANEASGLSAHATSASSWEETQVSRGNVHPDDTQLQVYRGNVNPVDESETYISKDTMTKMKERNTVMLDCGSRVNVIGAKTLEEYSHKWKNFGYMTEITKRENLLKLSGVGDGHTTCKIEAKFPIAVEFDGVASQETMQANVAEGSGGEYLPCILGLDSMTAKDGLLILRQGRQCLALPGPGGYKIEWSPGTKLLPIERLPSGHLGFTSDNYDKVNKNTTEQLSFVTDHTRPPDKRHAPIRK